MKYSYEAHLIWGTETAKQKSKNYFSISFICSIGKVFIFQKASKQFLFYNFYSRKLGSFMIKNMDILLYEIVWYMFFNIDNSILVLLFIITEN